MIAGKAAGVIEDLITTAHEHAIPEGKPLQPNQIHYADYQSLVAKYIQLQSVLSETFVRLDRD
jgi:hypothetical protein